MKMTLYMFLSCFMYFTAKCPIPSDISNGEINYSGLYEDDYVNYQCDYDFERIGPEVRTCKGGSWTEEEPRCGPVGKLLIVFWMP